jgi:long-chain acyl-CoA synthetase
VVNLAGLIDAHLDAQPAVLGSETISYGELRARAAGARGALVSRGVRSDDRVGIVCRNSLSFMVAYLAVLGVGAIAVPIDASSPAAAVLAQLGEVDAVLLIADEAHRSIAETVASAGGEVLLADEWASGGGPPVADRTDADLAALLFTSGTAGAPRAARLTHGNLLANVAQVQRSGGAIRPTDVVLGVLPFSHVFGLNVVLAVSWAAGAAVLPLHRFDPLEAVAAVRDGSVTVIAGAPPMWAQWAALTDIATSAFAGVRIALSGADKLPESVARNIAERFGVRLHEGYGLTEASPVVTSSVGFDVPVGSIGHPLDGVEIRLVDGDGIDVDAGDPGEIWVRGANVFDGYWNDPEASARVMHGEWLRTGDIAVSDPGGGLFIVDRIKDLIVVSGFNVYPAEVEQVITTHPAVADAAVVAVPDAAHGESVRAVIVLRSAVTATAAEIVAHCARFLPRYKCPTSVEFVTELPRGPAGKLLRRALG